MSKALGSGRLASAGAPGAAVAAVVILVVALLPVALGSFAATPPHRSLPAGDRPAARPITGPSILVLPSSGAVGSTVTVTGSGFTPNSTVTLALGGVPVAASCSTNASGAFGGTGCDFTVPAVPGGLSSVVATVGWGSRTFGQTGSDPTLLAYDAAQHELLVTNQNSNNVTILNGTTGRTLGSIGVGQDPLGVTVDAAKGEILVANGNSNSMSVINDTSNLVKSTVSTGSRPGWIVDDPSNGELYVSNIRSDTVGVYNDTNLSSIAVLPAQYQPIGLTFVPSLQQLFVVNAMGACGSSACGSVTVISTANDTDLGNVTQVGPNPYIGAYDSSTGQLYLADHGGDNVSILNLSSNLSADVSDGSVFTGTGSIPVGITYDSASGYIVSTDPGTGSVSVISDSTNSIVATIGGFSAVGNPLYVPQLNRVFVTDQSADTVSLLTFGSSANSSFTVLPHLSPPARAEVGQTVELIGAGFGASAALSNLTLNGSSLPCVSATLGSCVAGTITPTSQGSFAADVVLPMLSAAGNYTLNATDALANHATATIAVFLGPNVSTPVASPSVDFVGQPVTFTVTASGGAGGYSFVWSGLPPGCTSVNLSSLTCAPTTAGAYAISVRATDLNGVSGASASLAFVVAPLYTVTFTEHGLPTGSAWGVVVGSRTQTSTTSTLTVSEPNGNYSFVVLAPAGWASNSSGSFAVSGSNRSVSVTFTQVTYPVDFIVIGLPTGANWSVTISNQTSGFNQTKSTVGNAIVVFLANGTYTITFHLPAGYTGNFTSTQITVAGKSTRATLEASRNPTSPSGPVGTTLWGGDTWYLILGAAVVVAAGLAVLAVRRRPPAERFPHSEPGSSGSAEPTAPDEGPGTSSLASGGTPQGEAVVVQAGAGSTSKDPLAEVF